MKNIVIYIYDLSSQTFPFNTGYDSPAAPLNEYPYADAYMDIYLGLKARGVNAYFATGPESYDGSGVFNTAYVADHKCPPEEFAKVENIKADLVFNRGTFEEVDPDMLTPNPPAITDIIRSKAEIYKHFGKFQPTTIACDSLDDVKAAFTTITSELIVAKEPVGGSGDFVYIGTRDEVMEKLPGRYPLLVQEFMDTSVGIPGIADGMHDLRIEIAGDTILGGTVRQPQAPGEYRANIALGGKVTFLSPNEIPAEARAIALEIDATFAGLPRHYSIDFGNTPTGFKLIEMNRIPIAIARHLGPQAAHITDGLCDYLVKLANEAA